MHRSRLAKLAALTNGAALLGSLGAAAAGCDKPTTTPTQPPAMNATATPPATDSPPMIAGDAGDGDGAVRPRRPPFLNAPPGRILPD